MGQYVTETKKLAFLLDMIYYLLYIRHDV